MRLVLLVRRLQPNVGRYTTGVWTRQYLEQQLRLVLAGRAAEELVYGKEELSSLHQLKLMMARQVRVTSVGQDCNNNMQHSCQLIKCHACKHAADILVTCCFHNGLLSLICATMSRPICWSVVRSSTLDT
jgi:hypothetical protein